MPNELAIFNRSIWEVVLENKGEIDSVNWLDSLQPEPYHWPSCYPRDPKSETRDQSSCVVKQCDNVNCFYILLAHVFG